MTRLSGLGYKPQCHEAAFGRFLQEMTVVNAFCPLLLGLPLHSVAQEVNAAILKNEDEEQSLGKAE